MVSLLGLPWPVFAAGPADTTPASTYAKAYWMLNKSSDAQVEEFCNSFFQNDPDKVAEVKRIVDLLIAASGSVQPVKPAPGPTPPSAKGTSVQPDVQATTHDEQDQSSTATVAPNPPQVLTNASINASDNLNLVTTTLFSGAIRAWDYRPGVTLSATAATSKPSSQASTKYSDVQVLVPEGAALNLYLSPFNSRAPADIVSVSGGGFGDRRQVSDRFYFNHDVMAPSTLDAAKKVNELDDPITLWYFRDGIGVKMINRSQNPVVSASNSSPASDSTATTTADYGLAGSIYAGIGADGGLLNLSNTDAGAFRVEALVTASWVDKRSSLVLYPNAAPDHADVVYGGYLQFSLNLNSNIKLAVQYAYPFGGAAKYVGKAVLFGATVSR